MQQAYRYVYNYPCCCYNSSPCSYPYPHPYPGPCPTLKATESMYIPLNAIVYLEAAVSLTLTLTLTLNPNPNPNRVPRGCCQHPSGSQHRRMPAGSQASRFMPHTLCNVKTTFHPTGADTLTFQVGMLIPGSLRDQASGDTQGRLKDCGSSPSPNPRPNPKAA